MQRLAELKERTQWGISYVNEQYRLEHTEISKVLGCKPDTVRKYHAKQATPSIKFVSKFCSTFGFDYNWLALGEGVPFPGKDVEYPVMPVPSPSHEKSRKRAPSRSVSRPKSGTKSAARSSDSTLAEATDKSAPLPAVGTMEPLTTTLLESPEKRPATAMGVDCELSFQKLAILAGIRINNGWIVRLSERLGVDSWKISLSIYHRRINDSLIDAAEHCGFEKQSWIVAPRLEFSEMSPADSEMDVPQLLKMAEKVLRSNTIHATSLAMNIISMKTVSEFKASGPISGASAINLP